MKQLLNTIVSPVVRAMIYFFLIRRDGPSGKVVTATEFMLLHSITILKPIVILIPNRFYWILILFTGIISPNNFARQVTMEHSRFFRVAPEVGPELTKRTFREINNRYILASLLNFLVRFHWYGASRREQARNGGVAVPITYLISPTMRCNLQCGGCYAAKYCKNDDMPIDVVERVIGEAKDMGMYNVFILGGEPFIREELLDVYKKHSDCFFQVFTNGTYFDDELASKLAKLGNVVPLISIEGFEDDTDARRGEGTFAKIMQGMDNLRKYKVPFGYSSMATRQNVDTIISDEFNDMLIKKGCFLGWHFLYVPVGKDPDPELMPTAEQRLKMKEQGAERIRTFKPIITIDFWNDAPFTAGCIAGGKNYFHINSAGDLEPCIFIHFATDNVNEKPLRECLKSTYFKSFRDQQPYTSNLLRPCAIVDNPHVLRNILAEHKPYPTHPDSNALVTDYAPAIDAYSKKVAKVLDPVWEHEYANKGYNCEFFVSVLRSSREKYIREIDEVKAKRRLKEQQMAQHVEKPQPVQGESTVSINQSEPKPKSAKEVALQSEQVVEQPSKSPETELKPVEKSRQRVKQSVDSQAKVKGNGAKPKEKARSQNEQSSQRRSKPRADSKPQAQSRQSTEASGAQPPMGAAKKPRRNGKGSSNKDTKDE